MPDMYNPVEAYTSYYRSLHAENTRRFFDELVKKSNVNIDENRETVKQYKEYSNNLEVVTRKLFWMRCLRVIMIVLLVLIPVVIKIITPKIRAYREEIAEADKKSKELLGAAMQQMRPLGMLLTDRDALQIISNTIPLLSFDQCFTAKKESDMKLNFDLVDDDDIEQSILETLSGDFNGNPFLFEKRIIHEMGTETYRGSKTIEWTETYTDSNGVEHETTKTETLNAEVVKPKPNYKKLVVLNYGSLGAAGLSFSRKAPYFQHKGEMLVEIKTKIGERQIKRKADKALKNNEGFMPMSNTRFEVLFDALDRDNEVQFRTLFTPLAQTNIVNLILSEEGYGDDFNFAKRKRMNRITTKHSQDRSLYFSSGNYFNYSFDAIKEEFIKSNADFFKAVYFDFAPLFAIPAYNERPVHSLMPIPDMTQLYSMKEAEALANLVAEKHMVHPRTRTQAILKTKYVMPSDKADEISVTAYSYDIQKRIDTKPVKGGDGYWHNVEVEWDDYIPLVAENNFYITERCPEITENILATNNGLCIF